jgi:transposase-like protein
VNNNKVLASSSSPALPPAGRREPERSEGDRSAAGGNAAAHPDPEVVAQAQRRHFTAEYKQRILAETDQAKGSGSIGALLRREGLYSSLLATWRREREAGVRQALSPQKRGPKSKRDPVAEENQQLRRETQRLTEELRKAEIVIDIQKKVATLLGRPLATVDPEEKP